MKLRDVLVPKPFVGVVLWASVASVLTLYVLMPEPVRIVRAPPPPDTVIEVTAKPTSSKLVARPTALHEVPERGCTEGTWPDRTHEIVVRTNPVLSARGLHLGFTPSRDDPTVPGFGCTVTKTALHGNNVLIRVTKADAFERSVVELETVRVIQGMRARVEVSEDFHPRPPPEWEDVHGDVALNTWDWSSGKALVLEYTLYGTRGGMRRCVHDRVVIDF